MNAPTQTDETILPLPDQTATEALGGRIAALLRPGDCVLLDGPLGAGKSTLARALLRALAADPALEVPSPSYTLAQSYDTPAGVATHFDLWRLDGPAGMVELGWEEARAGIAIVEWPDRLGGLAPADALRIGLEIVGEGARRARISGWAGRGLA
jgi:tRNA threonylcarbamoyladenosine biosynthesis protein TsaE